MLRHFFLLTAALGGVYAQTLLEALSKVPELSNFTTFYQNNQAFAAAYFGNDSSYPITFLAPSNDAFTAYYAQTQVSLFDVRPDILLRLVQYHTLVSDLKQDNFTSAGTKGITAPTMLKDSPNNNRTVGSSLAAKFGGVERARGQVVFISAAASAGSPNRFLLSRQSTPEFAGVRSGLASTVNVRTLDANQGTWDGGSFHVVDGLLTPPDTCQKTIRTVGLAALDGALNRTKLWSTLDGTQNITCLGPTDAAFAASGNLDTTLNETSLTGALKWHTLPEVAYSDLLVDGQEFTTLNGGLVRVKVEEKEGNRTVWFNNAKVINANVLTHNGLIHELDSVMYPLEMLNSTNTTASGTPSATASSTATTTAAVSSAAASLVEVARFSWGLWAFAASLSALL